MRWIVVLVLGLAVYGCDDGDSSDNDTGGDGTGSGANGGDGSGSNGGGSGSGTGDGCIDDGSGYFRATLTGQIERTLDLSNSGMECGGAASSDGGFTLTVSPAGEPGFSFIISIDEVAKAQSQSGVSGELNLNVTNDELSGAWSVRPDGTCTFDVTHQATLVDEAIGSLESYMVTGTCDPLTPNTIFPDSTENVEVSGLEMVLPVGYLN